MLNDELPGWLAQNGLRSSPSAAFGISMDGSVRCGTRGITAT
jgi:hypothetical protein